MKKPVDLGFAIVFFSLIVYFVMVVAFDVWCLVSGHAEQGTYFLPFVFAGFIIVAIVIRRQSDRLPPNDRDHVMEAILKDSYQHPDNHPKGRINAPDGTSD